MYSTRQSERNKLVVVVVVVPIPRPVLPRFFKYFKDKILLKSHLLSTLHVLQKVVYLIR